MSELTDAARQIAARAERMARLVASVERHLLADQAKAISALPENASAPRLTKVDPSTPWNETPADVAPVDLGHADPTPNLAMRLGFFRARQRNLFGGLNQLNRALDHFDQVCRSVVAVKPEELVHEQAVCPGWTVDLRARLGGCGKQLEQYRRNDGTTGLRSLCAGCRSAKGRAERAERKDQS